MPLTDRDEELLMTLVHRVRVISLSQVADTWWHSLSSRVACARRRMNVLAARRLVSKQRVMARPLPEISRPLACWKPGEAPPDFHALAWRLKSRWRKPARQTTLFTATKTASRRFGGKNSPRLKHRHQASHDLGVTQVYLTIRAHTPARARRWIGEDRLPRKRSKKLPDALILPAGVEPRSAIEFGGAYDATRMEDFHRDCQKRALPYEIW